MATWWQEFQAHADAVDRAIDREHHAAVREGRLWPPERKPGAGHEEPEAAAPGREPQPEQSRPGIPEASTEPEPSASEPEIPESEPAGPVPADDGRTARLDAADPRGRGRAAHRRATGRARRQQPARRADPAGNPGRTGS